MKTSKILLGIIVSTTLFTSMTLISCQKEDDELMVEDTQLFTSTTSFEETSSSNEKTFQSMEVVDNDISFAKSGVSNDCKKVDICLKNGQLKNVATNAAFVQLENGGMLFDCDPDVGLDLTEVITILTPRIIANGGDFTSADDQKDEFIVWFYDTYCPADGGGGGNADEGSGGVFEGDAGSNL